MADILLRKGIGDSGESFSIRSISQNLKLYMKKHVLLTKAGSNTTSHCFGFDKQTIFNSLDESPQGLSSAKTMENENLLRIATKSHWLCSPK